jgi:hypothetical protein
VQKRYEAIRGEWEETKKMYEEIGDRRERRGEGGKERGKRS